MACNSNNIKPTIISIPKDSSEIKDDNKDVFVKSNAMDSSSWEFKYGDYEFTVHDAAGEAQNNFVVISVKYKNKTLPDFTDEIENPITNVAVADLNSNQKPEVYVFQHSTGSGSYGHVLVIEIDTVDYHFVGFVEPDEKQLRGYMGHDTFAFDNKRLIQTFPIFKMNDPNCCPTGGKRQLYYSLYKDGKLRVSSVKESPAY